MARRQQQFALYAKPQQFVMWRMYAEAEGLSLTAWIRDTLDSVIAAAEVQEVEYVKLPGDEGRG